LNDSVGASYLERNWPAAFKETGTWPLASLRKCFLDGSLTRLVDPDKVLREKIPEMVARGDMGFAAGERLEGGFNRLWFNEKLPPEEIDFVYDVFVIRKDRAKALRDSMAAAATAVQGTLPETTPAPAAFTLVSPESGALPAGPGVPATPTKTVLRVRGLVPPELWNRFGSKIIPKLRSAEQLQARVELTVEVETSALASLEMEILQVLADLDLGGKVVVEKDCR
ncbi:MAG: AAA family ATPase, partial [Acidobacteria bacterium]|nr:AAA family ATPase [Acidobacteriota bacterium]